MVVLVRDVMELMSSVVWVNHSSELSMIIEIVKSTMDFVHAQVDETDFKLEGLGLVLYTCLVLGELSTVLDCIRIRVSYIYPIVQYIGRYSP